MPRRILMLTLLIASAASAADEVAAEKAAPPAAAEEAAKVATARPGPDSSAGKALSGISILGNQEAPKALVIVPWKSSEIGDPLGLDENLDGSRRPIDREVFMRELDYYDIRSGSK